MKPNWITDFKQALPDIHIREQEPMASHISFRLGGPAQAFVVPQSVAEFQKILKFSAENQIKMTILGAGSNVLVADDGVEGLVISTHRGLTALTQVDETTIAAQSGVTMAKLSNFARDLGLSGLEFAHGIPGTVGGGVFMNAGAYGGEMAQVVVESTILLEDGTIKTLDHENHGFAYRHTNFHEHHWVILETKFTLIPGNQEEITAKMQEYSQKRKASQPLEFPSAGSTFKRPVGGYAAALIDEAGLKGFAVGGAQVSPKHAGFVVNTGGATCQDVVTLTEEIGKIVLEKTGIVLEREIRII